MNRVRTPRRGVTAAALVLVALAAACTPAGGPGNRTPYAIFTPSVSSGPAPLTVSFNAGASADPDGTIVAWSWDFGDFTSGSGVAVSHTFGPGTYTVRLTVTDDKGGQGTSATVISVSGPPPAPTGLTLTGAGCCDTYADFSWNQVPGVDEYQVTMAGYFLGGCVTDHSATFAAPTGSGRVQAIGLCLGSSYDVQIRARIGPNWGPWSPTINVTL